MTEPTTTNNKAAKLPKNLIEALKAIRMKSWRKGLPTKRSLGLIKTEAAFVAEMMDGISPVQAVLLSIVVEESASGTTCTSEDICDHMGLGGLDLLTLDADLKELVAKSYLNFSPSKTHGDSYTATLELLDSIRQNKQFVRPNRICHDERQFWDMVDDLFCKRDCDEMDGEMLSMTIRRLVDENMHLPLVTSYCNVCKDLSKEEGLVLLVFLVKHYREPKATVCPNQWRFVFDRGFTSMMVAKDLENGKSGLLLRQMVRVATSDSMMRGNEYELADAAIKMFFPTEQMTSPVVVQDKSIISHKSIVKKVLYYNEALQAQVDSLARLLVPKNLKEVQARMKKAGMHTGFCCLFYGAAGAGKTELARQLAKATGRDLMQVDLSEVRSKWVGESEKNVQAIFDRYRNAVKKSRMCPILLFNEADAIMNKRQEGAERAVDKSENTIANIILQNLEEFDDGILIATTNLASTNMDPAYERRFLFKMEFDRPDEKVRVKIWQSMLDDVDADTIEKLSKEFDFTGGQIANIAKKRLVDEILSGNKAGYVDLRSYCSQECISSSHASSNIGFRR